jgi:hypothetical protein
LFRLAYLQHIHAGRSIQPADDAAGAPPVAVMSYRAWQQHHGLDPAVIGSVFVIDGTPITVVGIAPSGFFGDTLRQDPPDFWIPLAIEPIMRGQNSILNDAGSHWLYIGTELRMQRPGMAYMARPDGNMVHSNINFGDRPVKFLYFVNRTPKAVRP